MYNHHKKSSRSHSEPKIQEDYPFFMRQLQRNIIYCHQKYKYFRKKTLSLIKKPSIMYKSTKQTAIDFQQVSFQSQNLISVKENNGIYLYNNLKKTRNQLSNEQNKKQNFLLNKEMDQKMKIFKNKIQQKKLNKKRQEYSKKQNSVVKKYLKYNSNFNKMNFGSHMGLSIRDKVKPLTNPLKMIQNEHDKTRSSELNNGNYKKLECF